MADSVSFAFEHVGAKLTPFDLNTLLYNETVDDNGRVQSNSVLANSTSNSQASIPDKTKTTQLENRRHALRPIVETGGLIFPFYPSISENISVKYNSHELTHTNEAFNVYRGTDNRRITISNAMWTADSFSNAQYALAVIHFMRSYSMMDFGKGRSGRPPSPMWFSAYGNYIYDEVPVLLESASIEFPSNQDMDYVGVPEPGTPEHDLQYLASQKQPGDAYTWIPMELTVNLNLIVQHAPSYWTEFNLDDMRSGRTIRRKTS